MWNLRLHLGCWSVVFVALRLQVSSVHGINTTEFSSDVDRGFYEFGQRLGRARTFSRTKSSESFSCSSEGFHPDPNDCKVFYRCVENGNGFTTYRFECGPGTVFNPQINGCDHPKPGGCSDGSGAAGSDTNENEVDDGYNYDKPSSSSTTTTRQQTSTTKQQTTTTQKTTKAPAKTTKSETTTKAPTTKGMSSSSECTSDGFMGDANDCKVFHRCVDNGRGGFTKYTFSCSGDTVWDPEITGCNHAWAVKNADCTKSSGQQTHEEHRETTSAATTTTTTTRKPTQKQTTKAPRSEDKKTTTSKPKQTTKAPEKTTTQKQKPAGNDACTGDGFFGDSKNCKIFYRCVDNGMGGFTKHEYTCGQGTVWDDEQKTCNHEWAVTSCGRSSSTDEDKDSPDDETTSSTTKATTTTTSKTTTTTEKKEESTTEKPCSTTESEKNTNEDKSESDSGECKSSGFHGVENNCKKFYRCVENGQGGYTKYDFTCGDGTAWNQEIEACDHEINVKNCGSGSGSGNKEPEGTTESSSTTTTISTTKKSTTTKKSSETTTQSSKPQSTSTEDSKNQGSNDKDECDSEGFHGYKNNCKKFYRCVDNGQGGYTKYDFTCGDGTAWDQNIEACNHETEVKTCGSGDNDNEEKTTESSSSTSKMTTKSTTTTTEKQVDEKEDEDKEEEEEEKETESGGSKPSSGNGKCESEGFFGDPDNCKKFYRCVDNGQGGYTKYDFSCGDGTAWNDEIEGCDHEYNVKSCGKGESGGSSESQTTEQEKTSSTTESQKTTQKSSSTESEKTSESTTTESNEVDGGGDDDGDGECDSEGFHGYKNNCKKFYRCVDDGKGGYTKYDFSCGDGTAWNDEIEGCDHEYNVKSCGKGGSGGSSESQTTEGEKTSSTTESQKTTQKSSSTESEKTSESTTTESNEVDGGGNDDGDGECKSEGFHGYKNNCKKFYRCVDDGKGGYTKYDFSCGDGTAWNDEIEGCDHEYNVKSCGSKEEGGKEEERPQETGESSTSKSESTTSKSEESTTESQKGTSKSPDSGSSSSGKCESEGFYGNPKNCKKFYRCVDDGNGGYTRYDFDCGEGTIWDQDLTTCNHPQDVKNKSCEDGDDDGDDKDGEDEKSESTTESSKTTSTTSKTTKGTTEESTTESKKTDSNCKEDKDNLTCPRAGFFAHPSDCKKFYRCVDWDGDEGKRYSIYHFECGEGTIWDPELETCNHEESVYPKRDCGCCEEKQETTTTEKAETTTTEKEETTTTEKQDTTTTEKEETTTTEKQETTTTEKEETTATEKQETTTTEKQETTTEKQETTTTEKEETTTEKQETTTTEKQETTTTEKEETTTTEKQETTTTEKEETTTTEKEETTTTTTEATTTEQEKTTTTEKEETTTENQTEESTTEGTTTTTESTTEGTTESTTEGTTESTTEGTTESTTEGTTEGTTESSKTTKCPVGELEGDQYALVCPTGFRRHPKYCNLFYQCDDDDDTHETKVAVFKCPDDTIYDEEETKCVEESEASKECEGEKARHATLRALHASSRPPITVKAGRLLCPSEGHFSLDADSQCTPEFVKCSRSFYTNKMQGYVYQCPENYVYWAVSRRCERMSRIAKCSNSLRAFSRRFDLPLEVMNVATERPH